MTPKHVETHAVHTTRKSTSHTTSTKKARISTRRHCPAHVPEIFAYDAQMSSIAMRYIEPPHVIMRSGLVEGHCYPRFPEHCADYLANVLLRTSNMVLTTETHGEAVK